jgi:predicted MFS family arabinose efflux permease
MNTSSVDALSERAAHGFQRHYALFVLLIVGICSWSDRQIFSIVLEGIRKEFAFSDTQLGLLGGTAFGLFYVAVGLPVAWLADRIDRRNIIALAIFLWSLMTALCAAASGFGSLFLCRMGVGIGEAGGAAPSQSVVADLYPPQRRALAMGVLYMYLPLGYLLSYSLGGWINEAVGWREALLVFGIPGLLLAALVRLTVREPVRGGSDGLSARLATPMPLFQTIRSLLHLRAMRHVCLGGAAHGLGMFAVAVWLPSYFMRVQHVSSAAVGERLALIMGLGGLVGVLGGGRLADILVARTTNAGWYLWTCALGLIVSVPLTASVYLSQRSSMAFWLLVVPMILNNMIVGPVVASIQGLVAVRQRAVAAAIYLFLANLVAAGFGPLLIGAISDALHARLGAESLRYSLLLVVPTTALWAAVHFAIAGKALSRESLRR